MCFIALEVGFDPAAYTVAEGDTATLVLRLNQAPLQRVTVQLSTRDRSATGMLGL